MSLIATKGHHDFHLPRHKFFHLLHHNSHPFSSCYHLIQSAKINCPSPHILMTFFTNCFPLNLKGPFHDLPKDLENFFPLSMYEDSPMIPPYPCNMKCPCLVQYLCNELLLLHYQQSHIQGMSPKRLHSLSGELLNLLKLGAIWLVSLRP